MASSRTATAASWGSPALVERFARPKRAASHTYDSTRRTDGRRGAKRMWRVLVSLFPSAATPRSSGGGRPGPPPGTPCLGAGFRSCGRTATPLQEPLLHVAARTDRSRPSRGCIPPDPTRSRGQRPFDPRGSEADQWRLRCVVVERASGDRAAPHASGRAGGEQVRRSKRPPSAPERQTRTASSSFAMRISAAIPARRSMRSKRSSRASESRSVGGASPGEVRAAERRSHRLPPLRDWSRARGVE